jgi:hypothetical protein
VHNVDSLYERLQISSHDPYDDANLKVYGSLIHIDMKQKELLQAKEEKEVRFELIHLDYFQKRRRLAQSLLPRRLYAKSAKVLAKLI